MLFIALGKLVAGDGEAPRNLKMEKYNLIIMETNFLLSIGTSVTRWLK